MILNYHPEPPPWTQWSLIIIFRTVTLEVSIDLEHTCSCAQIIRLHGLTSVRPLWKLILNLCELVNSVTRCSAARGNHPQNTCGGESVAHIKFPPCISSQLCSLSAFKFIFYIDFSQSLGPPSSAYTLDGVNLKGYFAYALNDQRDPKFGLYGQVHEEVIVKASLSNYRNIIQHNGFPIQGAPPQECPSRPQPCRGCQILVRKPVVGFLTLVGSGVLITLGLIIYYTAKGHKECY